MKPKYAEVKTLLEFLKAEKAKIETQTTPLRQKRDELLASVKPILDQVAKLEAQYREIEQPRLGELDNQISALVRILGARRMSDSTSSTSMGV